MDDTSKMVEMRSALSKAEQVIYLGFSFLDQNMELLRSPADKEQNYYCTTLGLSPADKNLAMSAILRAGFNDLPILRVPPTDYAGTASDFLSAFGNSVRR
jgi:hypothetical protein